MKKYFILICIVTLFSEVVASGDSLKSNLNLSWSKISLRTDVNFMSVTGRTGFRGVGVNGALQVDYNLTDRATVGVYGGHATDISTKDRYFQIEDKVYNLTTSNLTFFGIGAGYTIWKEGRLRVTPDLRVGLGYFRVSEIFSSLNNSFILKRSLVMVMPRLNFSFLVGKRLEPGINFSYLLPYSVNGDIDQYDLGNVSSGVFCKFHF